MSEKDDDNQEIDPSWDNVPGATVLCLNGVTHDSELVKFSEINEKQKNGILERRNKK